MIKKISNPHKKWIKINSGKIIFRTQRKFKCKNGQQALRFFEHGVRTQITNICSTTVYGDQVMFSEKKDRFSNLFHKTT